MMENEQQTYIERLKNGYIDEYDLGVCSGVWDTFTKAYKSVYFNAERNCFVVCHYYAPQYGEDYGHDYKNFTEEEFLAYLAKQD